MTETMPESLPQRVYKYAQERGSDVALRDKHLGIWRERTWQEYYVMLEVVGAMLWEMGVRPGTCVGILSDNRPEWLFADLGAQGIGARSIGIYQTNPPPDVAYILTHSSISVLFCEDQEQMDKAVAVADETPTVRHVVVFDSRGTRTYDDPRLMSWETFVERGTSLCKPGWFAQQLSMRDPDEASMVVYTSGTTGNPKGVVHSHIPIRNTLERAQILGLTCQDVHMNYLPLFHIFN